MRVTSLDGLGALASILTEANLLGLGAVRFGAPDMLILNSGGPATHLAENSILCGPTNTRVVIRQPQNMLKGEANNALEGRIHILDEKPILTAEVEEWKHGCWYHRNIISASSLGDLMNKLKHLTPSEKLNPESHNLPSGAFWAGSIAYDMVQWTQPISCLLYTSPSPRDFG